MQAANESFATQRQGVIERGTRRLSEVKVLQAELETERELLSGLLGSA